MAIDSSAPIGIFDSGTGGLTVANAVKRLLPEESIIYFGDIAHLPYGDKSQAAIQAYSVKICEVLLQQRCKLVLIACNSASAAAFELVREYVGSKAKVMDVITPVIDYVRENYAHKTIGLIGTKQTVSSNVYQKKIDQLGNGTILKSLATPLLVPMIEEDLADDKINQSIINNYLKKDSIQNIEALILGCTHYPLIKKQVENFYQGSVDIIDSSEITARALKAYLQYNNLLNTSGIVSERFLVSDYTDAFEHSTKLFFNKEVHLEKYPIWE
ncbi:glutamate racemase [Fulvivirgaceae bacterium BMA10]|uniref:Glutamate racemase n=1 Tax=Splendidivirga corallicola TaxID=3051826 RepID=A0ABT8KMJ1_9BACT|nr:glutamate racemase [Fulvivirgaceae bacterium BMA10]